MLRRAVAVAFGILLGAAPLSAQVVFTVTTPSADVHKAPTQSSVVIGKAPRDMTFDVVRNLGSWVKVQWPGGDDGYGYLHLSWGTIGNARPAPAPAAGAQSATSSPASPPAARPAAPPPAAATPVRSQPRTVAPAPRALASLPSHVVGVGGQATSGPLGFSASGRYWPKRTLGIQLEMGRSTWGKGNRPSAFDVAPSVVYSTPDAVASDFWIRPYVGGGLMLSRATRSNVSSGVLGPSEVDNGLGYQAFGGAEVTWSAIPAFSVSADLRRQSAPTPLADSRTGRYAFSMSVHWYAK
jgi:hypothetical protein